MSRWPAWVHCASGSSSHSSRSIFTGSRCSRPAEAEGDPLDVGVDHHPGDAESVAEDHVGRLAPHPRQGGQRLQAGRHLPPCSATRAAAQPSRLLALLRKNPVERISSSSSAGSARASASGVGIAAKQFRRHLVDPHIGALGREDGGHQQLPGAVEVQGALGTGIGPGENVQHRRGLLPTLCGDLHRFPFLDTAPAAAASRFHSLPPASSPAAVSQERFPCGRS